MGEQNHAQPYTEAASGNSEAASVKLLSNREPPNSSPKWQDPFNKIYFK